MVEYRKYLFVLCFLELVHIVQNLCETQQSNGRQRCDYRCRYAYKVTITCNDLTKPQINFQSGLEDNQIDSTEVRIRNSDIEILPHAAFFNVKNMKQLSMTNANLTTIASDAFVAHSGIGEIHFQHNKLTSISNGIFNNLRELVFLDLSYNSIQNISESAFVLTALKTVNLSENSLTEFGSFLHTLPNLNLLDISSNNLTDIQNCSNQENKLEKNSSCIPANSTISELYLRNNRIKSIPPLNSHIRIFDIGNNMLTNLSIDLFKQADFLQKLYLDGNGLKTIPNSLFITLKHLKVLDLSNNNLSSFNYGTFDGLTELESFNVSFNRLKVLPGAFHSLGSLTSLFLQNNDLYDLNVELLRSMSNINLINLNGNKWNCQILQNISIKLRMRKITVVKGSNFNGTNVFGMLCIEDAHENSDKIDRVTKIQKSESSLDDSQLRNFFNRDFKQSALYRFFNEDFQNTSFAKHINDRNHTPQNNLEAVVNRIDKKIENSTNLLEGFVGQLKTVSVDQNQTFNTIQAALHNHKETFENSSKIFLEAIVNLTKVIDKKEERYFHDFIAAYGDKESNLQKYLQNMTILIDKRVHEQMPVTNNDFFSKNLSETIADRLIAEHSTSSEDKSGNTIFYFSILSIIVNILLISVIVYIGANRLKLRYSHDDILLSPVTEHSS